MPTQQEKVVVPAYLLSQHAGHKLCDALLGRSARDRRRFILQRVRRIRRRERRAIYLAVRRQWERIQPDKCAGQHVLRQTLAQEVAQNGGSIDVQRASLGLGRRNVSTNLPTLKYQLKNQYFDEA